MSGRRWHAGRRRASPPSSAGPPPRRASLPWPPARPPALLAQISEPVTVSGTFSSYVTYLIASPLCAEGVRRRYSDFDWLREVRGVV